MHSIFVLYNLKSLAENILNLRKRAIHIWVHFIKSSLFSANACTSSNNQFHIMFLFLFTIFDNIIMISCLNSNSSSAQMEHNKQIKSYDTFAHHRDAQSDLLLRQALSCRDY